MVSSKRKKNTNKKKQYKIQNTKKKIQIKNK